MTITLGWWLIPFFVSLLNGFQCWAGLAFTGGSREAFLFLIPSALLWAVWGVLHFTKGVL